MALAGWRELVFLLVYRLVISLAIERDGEGNNAEQDREIQHTTQPNPIQSTHLSAQPRSPKTKSPARSPAYTPH